MTTAAPELRPATRDDRILAEQRQYLNKIHLTAADRWIDGGAHIGLFSRAIAPHVQEVVGYEAVPANWPLWQRNTVPFPNIQRVRKALVGEPPLTRTIYQNVAANTGAHSFYIKGGARVPLDVPCVTIDDAITACAANKLKLDVEGAEEEILYHCQQIDVIEEIMLEWHFKIRPEPAPYPRYTQFLAFLQQHFPHVAAPVHKRQWTVLIHAYR